MVKRRFWLTIILALTLACMLIAPAAAPGKALAVTTVTGRMSPQVQISTPHTPDTDRFSPQAAYNTARREFLVVYGNQVSSNQIIQGQRVDSHLNKIGGEFNITMGGLYDWAPAVAYNSQEGVYLVVFAHDVSAAHDLSQCDIQGQFVNWNGALLGSNFTIQTWEGVNFVYPKVAYNHQRNEYLVVWKAKNINDHSTAIGMKILLNNGSTWYGTILASDGNPDTPDVIWDPIHFQYLVVWEYFNSQNKLAIAADLHDTYGNRLTPPGILKIAGDANNDYSSPHPAYSNDWYGIVMEKNTARLTTISIRPLFFLMGVQCWVQLLWMHLFLMTDTRLLLERQWEAVGRSSSSSSTVQWITDTVRGCDRSPPIWQAKPAPCVTAFPIGIATLSRLPKAAPAT